MVWSSCKWRGALPRAASRAANLGPGDRLSLDAISREYLAEVCHIQLDRRTALDRPGAPRLLKIGEVCPLTGLRAATLRNWEERYGLLAPVSGPRGNAALLPRPWGAGARAPAAASGQRREPGRDRRPAGSMEHRHRTKDLASNLKRRFEPASRGNSARAGMWPSRRRRRGRPW